MRDTTGPATVIVPLPKAVRAKTTRSGGSPPVLARVCQRRFRVVTPIKHEQVRPSVKPTLNGHLGCVRQHWRRHGEADTLPRLIETITALSARGVGFRSLTEAIDTTTPGGRLIFHIFGVLGQFERDLIQERTRADLAAAVRGRNGGRKPVITDNKLKRARAMVGKGLTVRESRPV